jgi:hypothetical protein
MRRCEHARDKSLGFLEGLDPSAPLHDQIIAWLFGTSVATHMLLVAGLKNPTVRKRYLATRELLGEYGRLDVYEELLSMLGCADWTRAQTERHLAAMTVAFEAAREVIRSPFFYAADISDVGRPVAIDGSQELIDAGYHREAVFWITATYSRCQAVLFHDAPDSMRNQFSPGYRALLGDLGIQSFDDLQIRSEQVRSYLRRLRDVAEEIAAVTPEIVD